LSAAVSFEPWSTVDADAFVTGHIAPAMASRARDDDEEQLLVIATDGELYGHHQPFREYFLARLVGRTAPNDLPYDRPSMDDAVARAVARGLEMGTLRERTSWSCDHGIDRWMGGCGCVPDGDWKAPLRSALERVAGGVDAATDHVARSLPGSPDPWSLREAWVDVVLGVRSGDQVIQEQTGGTAPEHAAALTRLMEAQRWRLSMFASCAWFWDRADRIETAGALRAAMRAARLVDGIAGTDLERRLVGDLRLIEADGVDGVALLEIALRAVGAPAGLASEPENPSARGLRATG
jgi:Domain of unknown function (DUF3536)